MSFGVKVTFASSGGLATFLSGLLAGLGAMSFIYEKPKASRRYEDYRRERRLLEVSSTKADGAPALKPPGQGFPGNG